MPSIAEDLARTGTAQWLRGARAQQAEWANRVRCFDAFREILKPYRSSGVDGCWRQSLVSPPGLLKAVARGANFASASVFNRWTANQSGTGFKRWPALTRASSRARRLSLKRRSCRSGPIGKARLTSRTRSTCRFPRWLRPICAPSELGPTATRFSRPASRSGYRGASQRTCTFSRAEICRHAGQRSAVDVTAAELESLAGVLVAAVLDDASLTPLGAFNLIRCKTTQLLSEPPEQVAVKASNAISELADRLLHRREGDRVLTADQARQLYAELTGLSALLGEVAAQ